MRIAIHHLAVDDDGGTQSFTFATEDELYRHLYEVVIENSWLDKPKPAFEEFREDPFDYIDEFRRDNLDSYNWDETVLDIPLWRIIRDSIQLSPAFQGLARRCRAALRFAPQLF
ncbi:hypothetical protein [Mesorhizobium sp. WSM2239]|uniref:Uncharacterized protein n=2 Tax=unclassified Mesorhizobium TaxID=325217 RepID=A0AAU8DEX1_9HYPH